MTCEKCKNTTAGICETCTVNNNFSPSKKMWANKTFTLEEGEKTTPETVQSALDKLCSFLNQHDIQEFKIVRQDYVNYSMYGKQCGKIEIIYK